MTTDERILHGVCSLVWLTGLACAISGVPIATPETVGAHAYDIDAELWFSALLAGHLMVFLAKRPSIGRCACIAIYGGIFPGLLWYDGIVTPAGPASFGFSVALLAMGVRAWIRNKSG